MNPIRVRSPFAHLFFKDGGFPRQAGMWARIHLQGAKLAESASRIVVELAREAHRLNNAGNDRPGSLARSRRERSLAFRQSLVERYREHRRCC